MHWGIAEVVMVAVGSGLALAGGWVLVFLRPRHTPLHLADAPAPPAPLSEPTRLVLAMFLILFGYHAIVWAFPRRYVGVQFERSLWYVWVTVGLVAIGLSLLLDQIERAHSSRGGDKS